MVVCSCKFIQVLHTQVFNDNQYLVDMKKRKKRINIKMYQELYRYIQKFKEILKNIRKEEGNIKKLKIQMTMKKICKIFIKNHKTQQRIS